MALWLARRAAVGLGAAALAACAAAPALPPILSLDGHPCAERPDLVGAEDLPLDAGHPVKRAFDADAACLETAGSGKSVYAVFRLPQSGEPYLLSVTSAPVGETLFSPRLVLLDGQGEILRRVPRDDFMFHGTSLYAGLRAAPAERYLVVASDPASIGQQVSHIVGDSRMIPVPVGIGAVAMIHSGSETQQFFTYAHNGSVTIVAQPMPKAALVGPTPAQR